MKKYTAIYTEDDVEVVLGTFYGHDEAWEALDEKGESVAKGDKQKKQEFDEGCCVEYFLRR